MNVIDRIKISDVSVKVTSIQGTDCIGYQHLDDECAQKELLNIAELGIVALETMNEYCDWGLDSALCKEDENCAWRPFCKLRKEINT